MPSFSGAGKPYFAFFLKKLGGLVRMGVPTRTVAA
ncbi:MAG: hypothetical protein GAK40_00619 [Burkholderia plantarii]|nr:MAG: hypothetical protein GAK40_00619 [Burkholderia plantarii]